MEDYDNDDSDGEDKKTLKDHQRKQKKFRKILLSEKDLGTADVNEYK